MCDASTIAAGIGAAGSVIGGLAGSSKSGGSTTNTGPWTAQQPYIKVGMAQAANLYGQDKNSPYYTGDTYANMDPRSASALNGAYNWANTTGLQNGQYMSAFGAPNMYNGGMGSLSMANALANYNPQDPTQQNIRNAGLYMNNDVINGQIDAASRDVVRNLSEDVLPGINRGAAAGGNVDSSRTGIAEGIALRGAQDRVGDIAAGIRYSAYNDGLNMAENARQFNDNAQNAAYSNAGNMYDRIYGRGMDSYNQGTQMTQGMYDLMNKVGTAYQADNQGQLDANFNQWQGNDLRDWTLLQRYMDVINGVPGGSSSTTSGSGGGWQGALQGALGGGASALSLYNTYNNIMNSSAPSASTYTSGGYNPYTGMFGHN